MSTKLAFTTNSVRIIAEDKIKSAIAEGEFDRLPGLGKPCPLIDQPYHPLWWVMRKMQLENLLPHSPQTTNH